jgi:FkbM family methyltransferase
MTMSYPKWAMMAVPYGRYELPGWGKILTAVGVFNDAKWKDAPERVIRGKMHGYKMRLQLSSWSERQTFFLGRYYDLGTQLFLKTGLRKGETLIDVGGNIGMITLMGASVVGPTGQVHTIEPNPEAAGRIQTALDDNNIKHVKLHRVGLADAPGEFTLSVITDHSGMGTLAEVEPEHKNFVTAKHTVQVKRGDDILGDLKAPVTMKMDIEGFECRALRGLTNTLRKYHPAIVLEVSEHHLKRAGASSQELFDLLHAEGYRSYNLTLRRKGLKTVLNLVPMNKPRITVDDDVAWIYPGTVHEERFSRFIEA